MKGWILAGLIALAGTVRGASSVGIRAGVNWANITENPTIEGRDWRPRPGPIIGAACEWQFSGTSPASLRLEAAYAAKGGRVRDQGMWSSSNDVRTDAIIQVDEVVLTPLFLLHFPVPYVSAFLEFGPEIGLNVKHEIRTSTSVRLQQDPTREIWHSDTTASLTYWKGTNVGLNLGAGVAVPTGRGEIVLDVRYNAGLSNMNNSSLAETERTRGVQFLLGYNTYLFRK